MAKYEFYWTDKQAEAVAWLVSNYHNELSLDEAEQFCKDTAQVIESQKPVLLLPTGLGAVVETDTGVFVRRIQNDNRDRVWWLVPDGEWFETYKIGRLVKVHAEGVEL